MGYRGTAAPHQSPSATASPEGEAFELPTAQVIGEEEVKKANDILQKYKTGKAALDKCELHLLALTGLQGHLGKTFQFPDRTVTLTLGRCYIELHRFLAGDCAGIFYRDGDLLCFSLTVGSAALPEFAVFKGRV